MSKWNIKNDIGEIIYSGESQTLKKFIEKLVSEGKSLEKADLRGADLSGLNLEKADFRDALLDECDFRGTVARYADFSGASMRGVQMQGMNSEHSKFRSVNFGKSNKGKQTRAEGARLAYSEFDGAIFDDAIFAGVGFSRSSMVHVSASNTLFTSSRMRDVVFSYSTFIACDFSESDLSSSTVIDKKYIMNRTEGIKVIHCRYKNTILDESTKDFISDRKWTYLSKLMTWAATTALVAVGTHHLDGDPSLLTEFIPSIVKDGFIQIPEILKENMTLIVLSTIALIVKDGVAEKLKETVGENIERLQTKIRGIIGKAEKFSGNISNAVVASIKGPGAISIFSGLKKSVNQQEQKDFAGMHLLEVLGPDDVTIFCDRRHLAQVLESICSGRDRYTMPGDFIVMRKEGGGIPTIVRFGKNGETSMVWTEDGNIIKSIDYDEKGNILKSEGMNDEENLDLQYKLDELEKGLLKEYGVELQYDKRTHELYSTKDGSIIVKRISDKKIDNKIGYAIIDMDGKGVFFRNGKMIVDEDDDLEPDEKCRCCLA